MSFAEECNRDMEWELKVMLVRVTITFIIQTRAVCDRKGHSFLCNWGKPYGQSWMEAGTI
jgi:hypothetical protein